MSKLMYKNMIDNLCKVEHLVTHSTLLQPQINDDPDVGDSGFAATSHAVVRGKKQYLFFNQAVRAFCCVLAKEPGPRPPPWQQSPQRSVSQPHIVVWYKRVFFFYSCVCR